MLGSVGPDPDAAADSAACYASLLLEKADGSRGSGGGGSSGSGRSPRKPMPGRGGPAAQQAPTTASLLADAAQALRAALLVRPGHAKCLLSMGLVLAKQASRKGGKKGGGKSAGASSSSSTSAVVSLGSVLPPLLQAILTSEARNDAASTGRGGGLGGGGRSGTSIHSARTGASSWADRSASTAAGNWWRMGGARQHDDPDDEDYTRRLGGQAVPLRPQSVMRAGGRLDFARACLAIGASAQEAGVQLAGDQDAAQGAEAAAAAAAALQELSKHQLAVGQGESPSAWLRAAAELAVVPHADPSPASRRGGRGRGRDSSSSRPRLLEEDGGESPSGATAAGRSSTGDLGGGGAGMPSRISEASLPPPSVFLRCFPSASIIIQQLGQEQQRSPPLVLLLSCAQWYARGMLECEAALAQLDTSEGSTASAADKAWADLQRGPLLDVCGRLHANLAGALLALPDTVAQPALREALELGGGEEVGAGARSGEGKLRMPAQVAREHIDLAGQRCPGLGSALLRLQGVVAARQQQSKRRATVVDGLALLARGRARAATDTLCRALGIRNSSGAIILGNAAGERGVDELDGAASGGEQGEELRDPAAWHALACAAAGAGESRLCMFACARSLALKEMDDASSSGGGVASSRARGAPASQGGAPRASHLAALLAVRGTAAARHAESMAIAPHRAGEAASGSDRIVPPEALSLPGAWDFAARCLWRAVAAAGKEALGTSTAPPSSSSSPRGGAGTGSGSSQAKAAAMALAELGGLAGRGVAVLVSPPPPPAGPIGPAGDGGAELDYRSLRAVVQAMGDAAAPGATSGPAASAALLLCALLLQRATAADLAAGVTSEALEACVGWLRAHAGPLVRGLQVSLGPAFSGAGQLMPGPALARLGLRARAGGHGAGAGAFSSSSRGTPGHGGRGSPLRSAGSGRAGARGGFGARGGGGASSHEGGAVSSRVTGVVAPRVWYGLARALRACASLAVEGGDGGTTVGDGESAMDDGASTATGGAGRDGAGSVRSGRVTPRGSGGTPRGSGGALAPGERRRKGMPSSAGASTILTPQQLGVFDASSQSFEAAESLARRTLGSPLDLLEDAAAAALQVLQADRGAGHGAIGALSRFDDFLPLPLAAALGAAEAAVWPALRSLSLVAAFSKAAGATSSSSSSGRRGGSKSRNRASPRTGRGSPRTSPRTAGAGVDASGSSKAAQAVWELLPLVPDLGPGDRVRCEMAQRKFEAVVVECLVLARRFAMRGQGEAADSIDYDDPAAALAATPAARHWRRQFGASGAQAAQASWLLSRRQRAEGGSAGGASQATGSESPKKAAPSGKRKGRRGSSAGKGKGKRRGSTGRSKSKGKGKGKDGASSPSSPGTPGSKGGGAGAGGQASEAAWIGMRGEARVLAQLICSGGEAATQGHGTSGLSSARSMGSGGFTPGSPPSGSGGSSSLGSKWRRDRAAQAAAALAPCLGPALLGLGQCCRALGEAGRARLCFLTLWELDDEMGQLAAEAATEAGYGGGRQGGGGDGASDDPGQGQG